MLFDRRGPFGRSAQLGIGDIRVDRAKACEGAKAAVTASYHSFMTDNIDESFNPLRHQFRMFDKIRCRVDHAWHQNLCIGNIGLSVAKDGPFMPMARV